MTATEPDRWPATLLLDAAAEALLAAQLGDERGCRRALRKAAALARRWSRADLSAFARPLRERPDDDVGPEDEGGDGARRSSSTPADPSSYGGAS